MVTKVRTISKNLIKKCSGISNIPCRLCDQLSKSIDLAKLTGGVVIVPTNAFVVEIPIKSITSYCNDLTVSSERSSPFKNNVTSVRLCPGGR